eukprot:1157108-Pelagomonas_calceolata.AAC.2
MCSPGWPHRGVEEDGSVCCREAGAPKQTMCRDIVHAEMNVGNMGDLEACQQLLKADSSMVLKEEGINRGFRNFAVRVGTRTPSKQMGRKLSERDKDSVVHQMYRGPAGHVLRPSATWEPLARSSKGVMKW